MGLIPTDMDKISVIQLRRLCKIYKLQNFSKLKKKDMVRNINVYISVIKLQRFIRKIYMAEHNVCPISMEIVKYPCYAFKPKGSKNFVYYNLEYLIDYLIQTGDFRDPKTREPYLDEILKSIDKYRKKIGLRGKSVYAASQNKSIYKRKKDHEDDIMVLERCLDEVISSIRNIMETPRGSDDPKSILNSYHFPTYLRYYKKLFQKSKFAAKHKIQTTIQSVANPNNRILDPNGIQDFILQFMFTIEATYESQF